MSSNVCTTNPTVLTRDHTAYRWEAGVTAPQSGTEGGGWMCAHACLAPRQHIPCPPSTRPPDPRTRLPGDRSVLPPRGAGRSPPRRPPTGGVPRGSSWRPWTRRGVRGSANSKHRPITCVSSVFLPPTQSFFQKTQLQLFPAIVTDLIASQ